MPCAKDTRQKAQSTRQKGSPLGAHSEDPTATGQTANTLFAVCPLSGTRQRLHRAFFMTHGEKKKRWRDDGETTGNGGVDGFAVSQIRRTANNFKKIKKSTSCPHRRPHPWCRRRRDERQGSRRRMEGKEAAAAGWRERKPPPEAPAPDLEGRRILHLRSSVRRAPSMEEEAAPPCAVVGEGGRPAVRRRW